MVMLVYGIASQAGSERATEQRCRYSLRTTLLWFCDTKPIPTRSRAGIERLRTRPLAAPSNGVQP